MNNPLSIDVYIIPYTSIGLDSSMLIFTTSSSTYLQSDKIYAFDGLNMIKKNITKSITNTIFYAYLCPNRYRWQFVLCQQSQTKHRPASVQQVKSITSVELVSLLCIVNSGPFFAVSVLDAAIVLI